MIPIQIISLKRVKRKPNTVHTKNMQQKCQNMAKMRQYAVNCKNMQNIHAHIKRKTNKRYLLHLRYIASITLAIIWSRYVFTYLNCNSFNERFSHKLQYYTRNIHARIKFKKALSLLAAYANDLHEFRQTSKYGNKSA